MKARAGETGDKLCPPPPNGIPPAPTSRTSHRACTGAPASLGRAVYRLAPRYRGTAPALERLAASDTLTRPGGSPMAPTFGAQLRAQAWPAPVPVPVYRGGGPLALVIVLGDYRLA